MKKYKIERLTEPLYGWYPHSSDSFYLGTAKSRYIFSQNRDFDLHIFSKRSLAGNTRNFVFIFRYGRSSPSSFSYAFRKDGCATFAGFEVRNYYARELLNMALKASVENEILTVSESNEVLMYIMRITVLTAKHVFGGNQCGKRTRRARSARKTLP